MMLDANPKIDFPVMKDGQVVGAIELLSDNTQKKFGHEKARLLRFFEPQYDADCNFYRCCERKEDERSRNRFADYSDDIPFAPG